MRRQVVEMDYVSDLSNEHIARALEIETNRFAFNDTEHPAVAALLECACRRTAALLAQGEAVKDVPQPVIDEDYRAEDALPLVNAEELFDKETGLPSPPSIFNELRELMASPTASADDFACVIAKDPGLAGYLLRLVNSPVYGFPAKIDTISRAVTLVGLEQLTDLAVGASVIALFSELPITREELDRFWRHSIATGILAKYIVSGKGGASQERIFVAGLLHAVGRLALLRVMPSELRYDILFAKARGLLLHEAEKRVLGMDYAWMGAKLLKDWNLPETLVDAVAFQMKPTEFELGTEPAVIHVADFVANAMSFGSSGEDYVPVLDIAAWESLEIPHGNLHHAATSAELQIEDACAAFHHLH